MANTDNAAKREAGKKSAKSRAKKFTFMPGGDSPAEKQYSLFRHHCGEIARRVRENPRCHKCFAHGWIGGGWHVNHGCDGCSEMESFIHAAHDAFANQANG